jgi:hypothetical protein
LAPPGVEFGRLRRYDLKKMADTDPPEPEYLVKYVAARGEVTQLWGAPGVGKSFFVEACCAGVGYGRPVAGLDCSQGRVLYVDAENGEHEVHRRVRNLDLPPEHVSIYDGSTAHLKRDGEDFVAMIDFERPDLLVLDSLRRLTPGTDENDSGEMAEIIGFIKALAQEHGLAALVIHHARKDGTTERGSSAIKDQVSVSWQMSRDPDDREVRRLTCEKMRIAKEPDDRWLRIVERDRGLAVVEAGAPLPILESGRPREDVARDVLRLLGKGGPLTRPQLAKALGKHPKDGTFRRAVDGLADKGRIVRDGDSWTVSPTEPTDGVAPVAPGTRAKGSAGGDDVASPMATKRRKQS